MDASGRRSQACSLAFTTSEDAGPFTSSQEQDPFSVPAVHAPTLQGNPTVGSAPLDSIIENDSDRLETDEDFGNEQHSPFLMTS